MYLEHFPEGSKVKLVGLSHVYRNVVLVKISHGCSYIEGFIHKDKKWERIHKDYTVSNGTETEARYEEEDTSPDLTEEEKMTQGVERRQEDAKAARKEAREQKKLAAPEVKKEPGKRGRAKQPRVPLVYPEGEFDMNQLATLNGMAYANCYLRFKEENKAIFVKEVRGGVGKPRKIYKCNI